MMVKRNYRLVTGRFHTGPPGNNNTLIAFHIFKYIRKAKLKREQERNRKYNQTMVKVANVRKGRDVQGCMRKFSISEWILLSPLQLPICILLFLCCCSHVDVIDTDS